MSSKAYDLTVGGHDDLVDMVAVTRWIQAARHNLPVPVDLNPTERLVAIHHSAAAGVSINEVARRLRANESKIRRQLHGQPSPVPAP